MLIFTLSHIIILINQVFSAGINVNKSSPYLGLIEGFFGRTWSFAERQDYASFLKRQGYHFYIYAPKNNPYLRKSWQQECPTETVTQLQTLISHYQTLLLLEVCD